MVAVGRPFEKHVGDQKYTAEVRISFSEKVQQANGNGYFDDPVKTDAGELINVTISATTLAALKQRIHAHIDIAERDD